MQKVIETSDDSLWQVETPQARQARIVERLENSSQLELRMGTALGEFIPTGAAYGYGYLFIPIPTHSCQIERCSTYSVVQPLRMLNGTTPQQNQGGGVVVGNCGSSAPG